MTVDDTVASLGKLLDERCGVDVITRSSSAVVADPDDDAIALLPLSLLPYRPDRGPTPDGVFDGVVTDVVRLEAVDEATRPR